MKCAGPTLDDTGKCPECDGDWRGSPIPQEYIDKGFYSPGATHYSRLIGIEIPGRYDGVSEWMCPDCKQRWDRWSGKPL